MSSIKDIKPFIQIKPTTEGPKFKDEKAPKTKEINGVVYQESSWPNQPLAFAQRSLETVHSLPFPVARLAVEYAVTELTEEDYRTARWEKMTDEPVRAAFIAPDKNTLVIENESSCYFSFYDISLNESSLLFRWVNPKISDVMFAFIDNSHFVMHSIRNSSSMLFEFHKTAKWEVMYIPQGISGLGVFKASEQSLDLSYEGVSLFQEGSKQLLKLSDDFPPEIDPVKHSLIFNDSGKTYVKYKEDAYQSTHCFSRCLETRAFLPNGSLLAVVDEKLCLFTPENSFSKPKLIETSDLWVPGIRKIIPTSSQQAFLYTTNKNGLSSMFFFNGKSVTLSTQILPGNGSVKTSFATRHTVIATMNISREMGAPLYRLVPAAK